MNHPRKKSCWLSKISVFFGILNLNFYLPKKNPNGPTAPAAAVAGKQGRPSVRALGISSAVLRHIGNKNTFWNIQFLFAAFILKESLLHDLSVVHILVKFQSFQHKPLDIKTFLWSSMSGTHHIEEVGGAENCGDPWPPQRVETCRIFWVLNLGEQHSVSVDELHEFIKMIFFGNYSCQKIHP